MGSNSGIRDGDFDRLSVAYDFAVGQDQNFGENGQVLISGGENNELTWGSNSASLPEGLVAGTNITFTPSGTYTGLVETTISSTDTGTTYAGVAPIVVDNSADTISLSKDATLTTISNNLSVVKVPNDLTAGTGLGFTSGTEFNGSAGRELVCSITQGITSLDEGDGINITAGTSATVKVISANIDTDTLEFIADDAGGPEPKEIAVKKVPNDLTAGTGLGFTSGTEFNGSAGRELVCSITQGITAINASDGIVITSAGGTTRTIKTHIDADTIVFASGSPTQLMKVAKVPNALTAGTNISFSSGTTYDGSSAITITGTDTNTQLNITEGNGITITNTGGVNRTISMNADQSTLNSNVGSGKAGVIKVPNALTAGTGISFSSGTTYDGSSAITISSSDATITETDVVSVYPVNIATYLVYRRYITNSRTSNGGLMYPIDTGFNYSFSSAPQARYYKVEIQFSIINSAVKLGTGTLEPVLLRLDKDNTFGANGSWDFPTSIITTHVNGNQVMNTSTIMLVDFGAGFASLSPLPKLFPVIIQQSQNSSLPAVGSHGTNLQAVIYYGGGGGSSGVNGTRGLTMIITPLGGDVSINEPTNGSPYTIPASDDDY